MDSRPKALPPKLDTQSTKKFSPPECHSAIPESGTSLLETARESSHRPYSAPASPKMSLKRFPGSISRRSQANGQTFAEFRKQDLRPRKQRFILESLEQERQNVVLQESGRDSSIRLSTSKDRGRSATSPLVSPSGGLSIKLSRISLLKGISRRKKKSPTETFHLLTLAIRDKHPNRACLYLEDLGNKYFKIKRKRDSEFLLLHAMANRMEEVCLAMIERGCPMDVNAPIIMDADAKHQYPSFFMLCLVFGLDRVIKAIIKKAKVNVSWYGLTPLMIACMKGDVPMVQYLIEKGADVNLGIPPKTYLLLRKLKYSQCTPVSTSTYVPPDVRRQWSYHSQPQDSLISEEFSKSKIYPIDIALMGERWDVADCLMAIMDKKGGKRSHILYFVVKDIERAFRYLPIANPPADQRDARNASPLHIAARTGNLEMVIFLMNIGCPIDLRGENGWTALHEAVSEHHILVARYLISQGASLKETTQHNDTPQMLALKCGYHEKDIEKCFAPIQRETEDYLNAELTVKNMSKLYPTKDIHLGSHDSVDESKSKAAPKKRMSSIASFISASRLSQG